MHDDGSVTVRGFVSIPADQAWFWTAEWQAGEGQAAADIASGRSTFHRSAEDMFTHLESTDD
ncbi:hypothetical protein GCM10022419_038470 [Nonomuraea rosea]|uniref:Uncharacterized protein n=1 Tax=Nonomuraea rosea TaxID=638574 RepID=A0ABP6WRI7_9ACTN